MKGTCGERLNCEHRYDSGLAFDFKQVACYSENREMENHTCAGNSPLVEKPCATKFVTAATGTSGTTASSRRARKCRTSGARATRRRLTWTPSAAPRSEAPVLLHARGV